MMPANPPSLTDTDANKKRKTPKADFFTLIDQLFFLLFVVISFSYSKLF